VGTDPVRYVLYMVENPDGQLNRSTSGGRSGEDIVVVRRTTAEELVGRVEVEWTLSATPDLEWVEIFQFAAVADRDGPVDWVMGAAPDVIGGVVRWFVPAGSLENAETEVTHRVSVANERFRQADRTGDAGGSPSPG